MKPIDKFKALYLEYHKFRWPATPDHCRTYPNYLKQLKTTNGMTKAIIGYIRLNGWFAERIGTTGRYIDKSKVVTDVCGFKKQIGSKQWIPGTGTSGRADISAKIAGRSVEIEVKNQYTGDSMKPHQEAYGKMVSATGGVYFVATDFEGFVCFFDTNFYRNVNYLDVWALIRDNKKMSI